MKVKNVHIYWSDFKQGEYKTSAKIFVDGLGDIEINECLSTEMIEAITNMVEFALRKKFNMPEKDIKILIDEKEANDLNKSSNIM